MPNKSPNPYAAGRVIPLRSLRPVPRSLSLGAFGRERQILAIIVFACLACLAFPGCHPTGGDPSEIRLRSGKSVKVLSVTRTTLRGSDEPALSLQYETSLSFGDIEKLYPEAEEIFEAIRPVAEREKLRAAVVTANGPKTGVGTTVSGGVGWCWKQRADGRWGEPAEGDHARVPR